MRRSIRTACLVGAFALLCAAAYLAVKLSSATDSAEEAPDQKNLVIADQAGSAGDIPPARLPETSPPPELSINAWGPRDCFPVIRKPWYVSAQFGDSLLATDEPVLGLVIGNEIRAYSTNQLNEHEMVLDEIAGTPVLVTY